MRKELRVYLRTIRALCPLKQRRRFLRDLQHDILQFQENNPDCDMSAIIARFGTPTEIAASFIEFHGEKQSLFREQTFLLAIIAAIIALIIGAFTLALILSDAYSDSHMQRVYSNQEGNNYESTKID